MLTAALTITPLATLIAVALVLDSILIPLATRLVYYSKAAGNGQRIISSANFVYTNYLLFAAACVGGGKK